MNDVSAVEEAPVQQSVRRDLLRGCLLFGSLLLLALTLLAVLNPLLLLSFIEEPYQSWRSPDAKWELILTAGEPWIFGPHPLYAYRRSLPAGLPQRIFSFKIANDGAILNDKLCRISWPTALTAALTCEGQEQPPTTYLIDIAAGRLLETDDPRR